MRKTTIISVTPDHQLELPPEIQAQLTPGDEYLIWQTEDTLLLKKVQKPLQLDELFQRVDVTAADTDQPSEAEICQMVKAVRHARSGSHESHS
jgi:hypothetical protein